MATSQKRTYSAKQTNVSRGEVEKRKRLFSYYSECKSSTESLSPMSHSIHTPTDIELSSESEFEEHDYCLHDMNKRNCHTNYVGSENTDLICNDDRSSLTKNRKPKCNSKNAVIARKNRLKKKKFIEDLERRNAELEAENKALQDSLERKKEYINSLIRKAVNLSNVIKNRTEIGSLLKCIHLNTNLKISSSLLNELSTYSQDSAGDYHSQTPRPTQRPSTEEGNLELNQSVSNGKSQIPVVSTIFDEDSMDFGLNTPALNQTYNEFENNISPLTQSQILTETKFQSEFVDSDIPLRCETPSKGFDELCNKENLFDDMGLCLHIANNTVSLEFCDTCNLNASM